MGQGLDIIGFALIAVLWLMWRIDQVLRDG